MYVVQDMNQSSYFAFAYIIVIVIFVGNILSSTNCFCYFAKNLLSTYVCLFPDFLLCYIIVHIYSNKGFLGGSVDKESACSVGKPCSIPGLGRSPGGGNSKPLQYSYLENSVYRGTWWPIVLGVTKSWTQLSD